MLIVFSVAMLACVFPALILAGQGQPPGDQGQPMDPADNPVIKMRDMRLKIEAEKDPAARQELMREHLKMMKEGMDRLCMMAPKNPEGMPMGEHKGMMGKNMGQGGGTPPSGEGMGAPPGRPGDDRMRMMDQQMMMMQETLSGIVLHQELMMK